MSLLHQTKSSKMTKAQLSSEGVIHPMRRKKILLFRTKLYLRNVIFTT